MYVRIASTAEYGCSLTLSAAIRPRMGLLAKINQEAKKNPSTGLGLQAYLLSHIKAPLREEKREVANHPLEIYQTRAEVSRLYD